jgi:hypothetical protein
MGWRASEKTVRVKCPVEGCEVRGDAAANAVGDDAPLRHRAACPVHDVPLVPVTEVKK